MRALALLPLALFGCKDETISGYTDRSTTYQLLEFAGEPFAARATIRFPKKGTAQGLAPCNAWSAKQSAPYPWVELDIEPLAQTTCDEFGAEQAYLQALRDTAIAEVNGPTLILTTKDGNLLVFQAIP